MGQRGGDRRLTLPRSEGGGGKAGADSAFWPSISQFKREKPESKKQKKKEKEREDVCLQNGYHLVFSSN